MVFIENYGPYADYEVFAAMKFQVAVFWVVTPYGVVVGYHCFEGPYCLHLQGEVSGAWIEIQVLVIWVVMPCDVVVGHQIFREHHYTTLQSTRSRFVRSLARKLVSTRRISNSKI
jgi:hypothetical protein